MYAARYLSPFSSPRELPYRGTGPTEDIKQAGSEIKHPVNQSAKKVEQGAKGLKKRSSSFGAFIKRLKRRVNILLL
jgi:hypothetical protein